MTTATSTQLEKPVTIASLIDEAMAGRTKKSTAMRAGIALSTFERKMLAGGDDFKVTELRRIAAALGVHPATLMPPDLARAQAAA